MSLCQASSTCINESFTVIREKNWIFFVDGVGSFSNEEAFTIKA